MDQAVGLGLGQRVTDLPKDVDRPFRRRWPEVPEQRVVSFAELLPEIVVKPVARATVVGLSDG